VRVSLFLTIVSRSFSAWTNSSSSSLVSTNEISWKLSSPPSLVLLDFQPDLFFSLEGSKG